MARTQEKLDEVKRQVELLGGKGFVHRCDLTDFDDIDRMANEVLDTHGHVDILVNNAGKSIRRSVNRAYDRFHDYQRTMQLNYFAPVKLILDLLPVMREQRVRAHHQHLDDRPADEHAAVLGVRRARRPRSTRSHARSPQRVIDDGVHITTVYMPLVRTPMIAPTKIYDRFPTLSPEEAAAMITDAIRKRPKRMATSLGNLGQLSYAIAPGAQDLVVNRAYKLFPEGDKTPTSDKVAPADDRRADGRAAGIRARHARRALVSGLRALRLGAPARRAPQGDGGVSRGAVRRAPRRSFRLGSGGPWRAIGSPCRRARHGHACPTGRYRALGNDDVRAVVSSRVTMARPGGRSLHEARPLHPASRLPAGENAAAAPQEAHGCP